ncbi:MAG: hypothetical protein ACTHMQ_13110 [Protaetiibacter sp.]
MIPGDATVLRTGSSSIERTGELLLDLAVELERIAADDGSIGDAADTIRGRTREAAGTLRRAEPRYTTTAGAVHEFAVALADLQSRHRDAMSDHDDARGRVDYYERQIAEIDARRLRMMMSLPDPDEEADLARRRAYLTAELGTAQSHLFSAEAAALEAEREWDVAARAAADRIHPALETLNDSFLEKVGAALDDIGTFIVAVAEWVAKILDTIITTVLLLVMVVVALVVVLSFVFSVFGIALLFLLATGTSLDEIVEILVGITITVVPILTGAVAYLMLREALTPTPTPVPVGPAGGRLVDRGSKAPYEYLFDNNGALDRQGGLDETVVEIVQVMNPDGTPALDEHGNPIWRVTLPSTQDWQLPGLSDGLGDHGGVNDLGSNLALILTPEQQAAYERAVLVAMQQAGIGPDDSVMLVGWSQGGIVAGAIASDRNSGFNVRALAVAGSPIDHMAIPDDVSVLAFQHDGDHVPRLDGTRPIDRGNWKTVQVPAGGEGYPHDSGKYADTARGVTTGDHVDADVQRIMDRQEMFFSPTELAYQYSIEEKDTALL